ncbi:MAG: radical SAM protein, partial [Nanoarchaeota archaeon]|nr:radical SAM protein [Nanoarchaeota archaeon]
NIEVSGICNYHCDYCPYPTSKRKKGLMDFTTFKKCMELIDEMNQKSICLHNFGEPLIHPDLSKFIKYADKYVDRINLSTNGILLTRELAKSLKKAGLTELYLSYHNKDIAERAKKNCEGLNLIKAERRSFSHDWAGTAKKKPLQSYLIKFMARPDVCHFIDNDAVTILWDGRINSCCIDMEGLGVLGSVYDDDPFTCTVKKFSLCDRCHKPYGKNAKKFYSDYTIKSKK